MIISAHRLTRLYDRLTIWERIPLLISAQAREDDAEYRRLFETSAIRPWHFSEHFLAEQALHVLSLMYITEQLDAAGVYFFSQWQLQNGEASGHDDWLLASDTCSYFFTANASAWWRFWGDLAIEPEDLTAGNYRGWFLQYCEEHMPAAAPSVPELGARMRKAGHAVVQLATSDSLLASWQSVLHKATGHAVHESQKAVQ